MTAYNEWEVATSVIRSHLVENSLTELDPDGLLTSDEAEKLADRLNTRTIEAVRELMGESFVIRPDGAVLMEWGESVPPGEENVLEEVGTYLAGVDYDSCYEDL